MRWLPLLARLVLLPLAATSAARAEPSEAKRELISELMELSAGDLTNERLAEYFLAQIEPAYPELIDRLLEEESSLSPEDRERLRAHLSDFDRFAARFRARFAEHVDLESIVARVYVPLYDRYFDEAELRDIVAFYRTPAGRKTLEVMPAVMREGLDATVPVVRPRVAELLGEILAAERNAVLAE